MTQPINSQYRGGIFPSSNTTHRAQPPVCHDTRLVRVQTPDRRYQKIELEFPISGRWICCWVDRQSMTREDYLWWINLGLEWMRETNQACEEKLKEEAAETKAYCAAQRKIQEESRKRSEELRKQIEQSDREAPARKQSVEKARRKAEQARKDAEQARKDAEQARKDSAETRRKAEETRRNTEKARRNAEEARKSYENTLKIAEEAKKASREVKIDHSVLKMHQVELHNKLTRIKLEKQFDEVMRQSLVLAAKIPSSIKRKRNKQSILQQTLPTHPNALYNVQGKSFCSKLKALFLSILVYILKFCCLSKNKKSTPINT